MLVRIGTYEPLKLGELPAEHEPGRSATRETCQRLRIMGLATPHVSGRLNRRYSPEAWWLNRKHPAYREIRSLLVEVSRGTPHPMTERPKYEPDPQTAIRPNDGDLARLFGSRNRTTAIMVVGLTDYLDASTIARVVGITTTWRSLSLLRPITRDKIFSREPFGTLVLYRLRADHQWSSALKLLIARVAAIAPQYQSLAKAAELLKRSGPSSPRQAMRHRLEQERGD